MAVAHVVFVVREKETIHNAVSYLPLLREGLKPVLGEICPQSAQHDSAALHGRALVRRAS